MESETKLEPCPGCGKIPDLEDERYHYLEDGGEKWGGIQCCWKGPAVRTGYKPWPAWRDDAVLEWNTRPSSQAAQGLIRALETCNRAFGRINLGVLEKDVAWDVYFAEKQARAALKAWEDTKP